MLKRFRTRGGPLKTERKQFLRKNSLPAGERQAGSAGSSAWRRWLVTGCTAILACAFTFACPSLAQKSQKQKKEAAKMEKPMQEAPAGATYVGSEACKSCHEDIYNQYDASPHYKNTLQTYEGPSKHGCEACHGPGSAHIDNPGDPTTIFHFENASPKQINDRCLGCHVTDGQHASYSRAAHSLNDVACTDCHSVHHPRTSQFLLVKSQPELCYTCHADKRAQFDMPFHHRVNEGLVKCSDCHNPHGTPLQHQLNAAVSQDAVCFTCHADKQGPFVFEHEPIKTEGCTACHTPHGSSNPHLLKFSSVNLLCLQCHTVSSFSAAPGTPSFHNQTTQFQACTICHVKIHGSNFNQFFFK
jgi:DmsE family decaheme c-type cytochrome